MRALEQPGALTGIASCAADAERHTRREEVAYIGWWPELEGDGTLTMTKPSSSMELPILLTPFAACTHSTQCR